MHLGQAALEEREVTLVGRQPRLGPPDVLGEPHAVAERDELVLFALPVENGHADRGEIEAPRPSERHSVVEPAVEASLHAFACALEEVLGRPARQHLEVGRAEKGLQHLHKLLRRDSEEVLALTCEQGQIRLLTLEGRAGGLDVQLAHPLEEVEPLGVEGRRRCQCGGGPDAIRQKRRCRQCVRPTSRDAPDAEAVDAECVADRDDVFGAVRNRATLVSGRARVAGPVIGEEPDPLLLGVAEMRLVQQA